jgi:hypothetical protein
MSSHMRHPASDTSAHVQNASSKVAKPSEIHIPPPPMSVNNKQNINKTLRGSHKCLPPPYEGSIYDTDDEIFFQQCANKIKKLLLTHGAVVTASYACQYLEKCLHTRQEVHEGVSKFPYHVPTFWNTALYENGRNGPLTHALIQFLNPQVFRKIVFSNQ